MVSTSDTPLVVVVGPTGSGKTALAMRLAELGGGEVVSADSVQVYRHFDIGSAKPTAEESQRVPHHLIDVADPLEPLEAAQWVARAETTLAALKTRGVRPILCGGTFLWIRALLFGLARAPAGDPQIRARHQERAHTQGPHVLYQELSRVDPESAARLHPNDLVRVSRALEVFELTGEKLSRLQAEHGFRSPRHRALLVGVQRSSDELDQRLRVRCQQMFERGWLDEVRCLLEQGFGTARAMNAVGYRQISEALKRPGFASSAALEVDVVRATRVFARRQRTWLRDQPVRWLDLGRADDAELARLLTER